jgi:HlyD family secretion protein/epimerase transport system membrane fusion protein
MVRDSGPPPADAGTLALAIRRPVMIGLAVIVLFIGGFGLWGAVAPLAGGAIAPGVISPDGSRRTVQHLEGGIIGELLVKEHDTVEAGAALVVLEETQPRANFQMQRGQHRSLLATYARLDAEQLLLDSIVWPAELADAAAADDEVRRILASQEGLFATRAAMHSSRKKVLGQRIEQLGEQIKGLEAQVESATRQLAIVAQELDGKRTLLGKGLIPLPEVLRLEREQAEVLGDRGEYVASIARAKQQIGETELQLVALDAERAGEIAKELDRVRTELAQVSERLFASADVLKRTVIPAPISGRVVNLRFKTRGGVVRPGEPLLDIVPIEEDLLIDAQVAPNDVDVVHPGTIAQIHFSAFTSRNLPRIDGRVRSISADRLTDEKTGHAYYLARVQVDRSELEKLDPDMVLVPGMPAEVLIVKGERTMVQYLFEPFTDVLRRAFRES